MKKYMICILLPLLVWGCFKDQGNYDYVKDIEIKVDGIEKNCGKKYLQDKLKIQPTVQAVRPNDRCEYLWLIYPEGTYRVSDIDTIGREKDLDWTVDVKPGNYTIEFIATDCDRLNYFKRCTTKLIVATHYTEGWYILKETEEQTTELDLFPTNGADLVYLPEQNTLNGNLLASVHGAAFPGKPNNLGIFFNIKFLDEGSGKMTKEPALNVITEDNAYILRAMDLSKIQDRSSMFYEQSDGKPYALRNIMGYNRQDIETVYLSSEGISYSDNDQFGVPVSKADYPAMGGSPFGFHDSYSTSYTGGLFFYFDQNTGTFCYLNSSRKFGMCDLSKGRNIPHRIIHYAPTKPDDAGIKHFALFKDKDNSSKHYLYKFIYGTSNEIEISEVPENALLNRAEQMVLNGDKKCYYFVADNKLYRYQADENEEEAAPILLDGISATEKIVLLKERYYAPWDAESFSNKERFRYFVVATYDGANYRFYFYNTIGGTPSGKPVATVEGKGKPVDIQYMTSDFKECGGMEITDVYNEY